MTTVAVLGKLARLGRGISADPKLGASAPTSADGSCTSWQMERLHMPITSLAPAVLYPFAVTQSFTLHYSSGSLSLGSTGSLFPSRCYAVFHKRLAALM